MKEKIKQKFKKILSIICILTLVAATLQLPSKDIDVVQAADEEYLSFSDLGINDTAFSTNQTLGMASLDGLVFQGKFKFDTLSGEPHLMFGGDATDFYGRDTSGEPFRAHPGITMLVSTTGIQLRGIRSVIGTSCGATNEYTVFTTEALSEAGINLTEDELTITLQFSYSTDKLHAIVIMSVTDGEKTLTSGENVFYNFVEYLTTTNVIFNSQSSTGTLSSVESSNSIYKTFSNFRIDDTEFTINQIVKGITSLDGVTFKGKIKFETLGGEPHFMFGGSATDFYGRDISGEPFRAHPGITMLVSTTGIQLRGIRSVIGTSCGATNEYTVFTTEALSEAGINLTEDELTITLQFSYSTDKLHAIVIMSVTDGEKTLTSGENVFYNFVEYLTTTNVIFNSQSSTGTLSSVSTEVDESTYTDINFASFGISSQVVGAGQKASGSLAGGETLHGKHFTGRYRFSSGVDGYLGFGGSTSQNDSQGISLWTDGSGGLWVRCWAGATKISGDGIQITRDILSASGIDLFEVVIVEAWIEYADDNNINVTWRLSDDAGDSYEQSFSYTYTGIADMLSTTLIAASSATADSEIEPAQPTTYTDINFASFGISSQVVGVGQKASGSLAGGETLHGKHFTGRYKFSTGGDGYLGFGGSTSQNDSQGISLWTDGNGGLWARCWAGATKISGDGVQITKAMLSDNGLDLSDTIIVECWIEYADNDNINVTWKLSDTEGDSYEKELSYSYTGITDMLSTTLIAASSATADSEIEPAQPTTYTDINFASFGISSQVVGAGQKASGSLAGGETLHGKHFTGRYKFSTGGDGYLGFGGSTSQNDSQGISLWTDGNGGLWARCWAGATKISGDGVQITKATLSESGIDLSDIVIVECWIEYVNNDNINVTWKLSDTEGDSYEKELSYSYTGITGMLSTTLIVASPAGTNSEIEPAEPTTYTDIDFASFNIPSQVVGAGQTVYGGLANDETLHGKHFTGRYRFSTGADGYIGFGGSTLTLDSQGISLWTDGNGGLLARCWVATKKIHDGEAISKAVLSENGIDLSKEVTVELWIEYKDTNNVNVTWKLSDEDGDSYKKDFSYTYEGITDLLSTYLIVTSSATADSEIEPEQPVAEGETIVTFYDFDYIEDMTMSAGTENAAEHIKGQANCIESFDNVTFKGTVSYETNATLSIPVLLFGGEKDSEQWTNINGAEKGFYLQLYDNGDVKMGVQRGTVNSVYTIGTAFTSGTSIDLQINFAYDEDDLRVTVYLTQGDTTIEHTARFKGAAAAIGTSTWLVAAPYGAKMTIASAYTRDVTKSDDAYMLDLKNPKAYLLTGKDITVNGISKTAGDTLSESGEYTIVYMKNGVKYTQKVSIYALGDLDTNASIIDGNLRDVVDSKTLVKMKKYIKDGAPTSSTQRAADLTNDEVVDDADAVFLRKVLVGLMELDEYYPASLSYEFIGGSDVMPISGYYGPYAKDGYNYITAGVYKTMQDANINLIVSSPMDYLDGAESNQNLRKALALGEKYKIGMYVLDSRLNQIVPTGKTLTNTNSGEGYGDTYAEMERVSFVKTAQEAANYFTNYSYFDSYLGNFAKDEPCTDTFPATGIAPLNTGNHIDWYGDVASILNNYSNSFGYMNAQCYFGRCKEKNWNLGTYYENTSVDLYTEYLNEILTKSQIPMLSFDNYMYAKGVDDNKRTVANTNTWIVNLDTVRAVAKSNDTGKEVPFWTYVAAGGYFDGDTTTITNTDGIMTQAQFNWQVNVPLAFGTKGLTYFPLIQPSDFANADDADSNLTRNGMINTEYETTKWYTYAQAINEQVTAIDHVLMKADNKGVIISEGTTSNAYKNMVNISYQRFGTDPLREYSVEDYTLKAYKETDPQGHVTKFTSSDTTNGAIAGVFSYQGETAYYVVNWSDANTNNVTLTFDKATNYTVIQNAEESTGSGDTCQLSLAAGEGVLVVLNN